MPSTNRLVLQALLMRLGEAVRGNDEAAADRYHRRIGILARQHFYTNARVGDALEQLLLASNEWLATKTAERYHAGQQVLEHIERVSELL